MPITPYQLEAGDILFKHASDSFVSKKIRDGQKSHYDKTVASTKMPGPMGRDLSVDISHVAFAVGRNDVMEFDEGGASKKQIVFGRGHGFVRGNMSLSSRAGNRYEVFSCSNQKLRDKAVDKAELIWDITHQGNNVTASYGLSKMLGTALKHNHGKAASTSNKFEKQLNEWLEIGSRSGLSKMFTRKKNIKFFCSEFVTFCYLWAASETKRGKVLGSEYMLGVDKSRISPVELYTRVETTGKAHFSFKGTLYTPG